jgi:hypothetical protein
LTLLDPKNVKMYKFVHYFIYNQQLQKGKSEGFSRWNGSMVAALAVCIHISFVLAVAKWLLSDFFNIRIPNIDHWIIKIVALGIFGLSSYWFNSKERTQRIIDQLGKGEYATGSNNAIKVIAIIFVPVIFIIILAQKSS